MGDSSNTGNQKVLSTLLRFVIKLDVQDKRRSLSLLRGRRVNAVESDTGTLNVDQEIVSQSDSKTWWETRRPNRRSLAAVDFYTLTDVVTANFDGCFADEFSRIEGTAPFDRVVLDYDEPNSGRNLRSLLLPSEAESRKLREVVAGFTGVAIFTKQDGLKVPNTNTVASVQLSCMKNADATLLADIQKADPSAGLGTNVIAVSASVSNNERNNPDEKESPQNQIKKDSNSGDGGLDVVIIVAIVIAILATTLLALALIIAWRRKKRAESAYMIGTKSSKVKSLKSRGRRGDSSNPSDTPTTERSGGNHSGKEPPLPGEEGEDDSELVVSQMSPGLYPESVISDDINSSLQAYEKSRGKQHPAQGAKREMDNQSVSSMESYGYSLDGYASSLAPSTQYGY